MKHLDTHEGQLLEVIIRKKQINISELANTTGIPRSKLYTCFRSPRLKPEIISRIGGAIGYDFAEEFPEALLQFQFPNKVSLESRDRELYYKHKYIDLLEKLSLLLEAKITPSIRQESQYA
jgi:hypothetical protein